MANKFQKSVLERLEEEAKRQSVNKKKAIPVEPVVSEEPVSMSEEEHTIPEEETIDLIKEEVPSEREPFIPDISQFIRHETQRVAKNKTFYLDSDVIDSIKITAKKQHTTDSKLVNDILRKVLGL